MLCDAAHITAFDEFWLLGRIPVELFFAADATEFWLLGRIPVDLSFAATFC